jgi:hypothetical protein
VTDESATGNRQPGQADGKGSGVNRRTFTGGAIGLAAVAGAGIAGWAATRTVQEHDPMSVSRRIVADRVGTLPVDPLDAAWEQHERLAVPLSPQHVTPPRLSREDGVIDALIIQALHDGNEIAFRLEWETDEANDIEAIARFTDSVAVQLPVNPSEPTSAMMGQPGRPVHILQWRASWQREVDGNARSVSDAFPHATNDLRPEDVFEGDTLSPYYPARHVGNLAAARDRESSVEEMVGEGFGTTTTHEEQSARGRAHFGDGRWRVAITMPLAPGDRKANLRPGSGSLVAVALWDGGKGDRGARKQWAGWTRLEVAS